MNDNACPSLKLALAFWQLGIRDLDWIGIARSAQKQGAKWPALTRLGGSFAEPHAEARRALAVKDLQKEMGYLEQPLESVRRFIAEAIVSGEIAPERGAEAMERLSHRLSQDGKTDRDLMLIGALYSRYVVVTRGELKDSLHAASILKTCSESILEIARKWLQDAP